MIAPSPAIILDAGTGNRETGGEKRLKTLEFLDLAATEICGTTTVCFFSELESELIISPTPHCCYRLDGSLIAKDLSHLLLGVIHIEAL